MSQAPCTVCGQPIDRDSGPRCARCVSTGLAAHGPSTRPPRPCLACGHLQLVRALVRERTSASLGDSNSEHPAPLAITFERGEEYVKFWSMQKAPGIAPDLTKPIGTLEAYVCRACGFVEWYANRPADIPIGELYGTELIEVPGGAYR